MTPTQKRAHARLMLRLPDRRAALERASGQDFLDVCEAYEVACNGLAHWIRSDDPARGERIVEYQELIASLEFEAAMIATGARGTRRGM